jgi:DNA-binding NarL/FixJ family response regulator
MITNVLIIYEEELFADGIERLIKELKPHININRVMVYNDLEKKLAEYEFDLVLISKDKCMDISYISPLVKQINPNVKFVLMSRTFSTDDVKKFMEYGVNGAFCKKYSIEKIKSILNLLLMGENYYPPELLPYNNTVCLTKQQVKLINELRKGYSNKQIAYEMNISESTVKAHMSILMKKLKVTSRIQVIKKAMELGYIEY